MKKPPTLNISWALSAVLCFWFLFLHAPVFLFRKDHIEPLLYAHLVGVYAVYLACVHNAIITPSLFGGAAKPFHVWGGRIGLVLGVIGFVLGFYLTWFVYDPMEDSTFSIAITIGGLSQMQAEFCGYRSIQRYKATKLLIEQGGYDSGDGGTREKLFALEDELDRHLTDHVKWMLNLFVMACGIPAIIRLAEMIGTASIFPLIATTYCLGLGMERPIRARIQRKRAMERGLDYGEEAELAAANK